MQNTIECHYTEEGSGPPLILIHGIGAARDAWRYMVPTLARHFTVVRYDLRGHGDSPPVRPEFGLDEMVNDLERVRQRTGFEQVHLAGHSLGGMIGPAYARRFPGRVLSLSLLSTAAFRTEDDSEKVRAVVQAMTDRGIPEVLQTLTNRWFTDQFISDRPDVVERRIEQVIATDPETFLTVFHIYANTEMQPWLSEIKAPTLVLTGELDGGCNPRLNTQIAKALDNAELVILPGIKHSILLEAPDDVNAHLIRFIQSTHSIA